MKLKLLWCTVAFKGCAWIRQNHSVVFTISEWKKTWASRMLFVHGFALGVMLILLYLKSDKFTSQKKSNESLGQIRINLICPKIKSPWYFFIYAHKAFQVHRYNPPLLLFCRSRLTSCSHIMVLSKTPLPVTPYLYRYFSMWISM